MTYQPTPSESNVQDFAKWIKYLANLIRFFSKVRANAFYPVFTDSFAEIFPFELSLGLFFRILSWVLATKVAWALYL